MNNGDPAAFRSQSWSQTWALYERAAELPTTEWERYVRQQAAGDAEGAAVLQMLREPHLSLGEGLPPDPELAGERAGSRIGRYRISGQLGRGGMGEVYAAFDEELSRPVALKFVRPSAAASLGPLPNVMEEAKAASSLNHPHIVTVHEVIPSDGSLVIVMELVPGRSLRALCGASMPAAQVATYGQQIARALAAAHAAEIIHRDVKPENLMVRPDGYIKLLDFGLARDLAENSREGAGLMAGTLRYMSPEQVQGKRLTPASDVFSLGVVLYELLNGNHPFAAASLIETLHRVTSAQPDKPNPKAPKWLGSLILRMLAKDPAHRPTASEVAARLERGGAGANRRWWIVIAAALGLALAGLAAFLLRNPAPLNPASSFFDEKTFFSPDNYVTTAAVSPDGNQLVYGVLDGSIHLSRVAENRPRVLAALPNQRIGKLSWVSNSGPLLVSSQDLDSQEFRISSVDLTTARLSPLPVSGTEALFSPDGSQIAYLTESRRQLWAASSNGTAARRLVTMADASDLKAFVWAPSGQTVHYFTTPESHERQFDWTKSIMHSVDAQSGKLLETRDYPPLTQPTLLADGRLIYYSELKGEHYPIMEIQTDPATGRLKGEPHLFATTPLVLMGSLSLSADGRLLAGVFTGRDNSHISYADVVSGSARLDHTHRFSPEAIPDLPHAWTPDGSTVIFESYRHRNWDIFTHRIGQLSPQTLVDLPKDQVIPQVSPDGRWVLFLSGPVARTGISAGKRVWDLMRIPLAGGTAEIVPNTEPIQEFACHYKASRCVIREYQNDQAIFFALDPAKGKGRELARASIGRAELGDWSLSHDGTMVAMVNLQADPPAIRVVYLDQGRETEIPIRGPAPARAVVPVWMADGKGWYFLVAGGQMRQFDWQGRSRFVRDLDHELILTHDGKRAAFQDMDRNWNVYSTRHE